MNIINKLIKYISNPNYRFLINSSFGFYNFLDDNLYLKRKFKACMGYELNLESPKTFNEKLQWMKLYDRNPLYTTMVDKYAVRDYISKKIGDEYLIPLLGVWDNAKDINFNELPNQFVLKCNHNSGLGMCICKDKSKLKIKKVKNLLNKGLKENYYLTGREWPYKDVKRKIVAEKYMVDNSSSELIDYKVMCFDGKPKLIQVHMGRFTNHTQDFYDVNWNKIELEQDCSSSNTKLDKPLLLEKMLELSSILSQNLREVRVDWYIINNKLYFGELTFFDASGFSKFNPEEYDYLLGDLIQL